MAARSAVCVVLYVVARGGGEKPACRLVFLAGTCGHLLCFLCTATLEMIKIVLVRNNSTSVLLPWKVNTRPRY